MTVELSKFAHPEYMANLQDWQTIRDCYKGSTAIKQAGDRYLPRLKNQLPEDYENYKRRALFFPITGKTASTLVGLATVKAPSAKYPDHMDDLFVDTGISYQFTEFYTSVLTEIVLMGRYGVLIDAPESGSANPTFVPYISENIINWDVNPNTGQLKMLILREFALVEDQTSDLSMRFSKKVVPRYRHCYIDDTDLLYKMEVLNDDLEVQARYVPLFNGRPINYIPYVPFGSTGVHSNVDKAPMAEIATINISHYMSSADLEWGRHFVGLPTPVVSGVDMSTSLHIGGTSAWILPPADAKAYYLEFVGQGLQSLEKALAEKISLMASVSARMMDNSSRGSEAADTVRLRYMSESASLIHILTATENGLNMLYNMMAQLRGLSDTVSITFSKEVLGASLNFKDLKVLFEAYMEGAVDKQTLLFNLKRLDAVDPNRSDEDLLSGIKDPTPSPAKSATPPAQHA